MPKSSIVNERAVFKWFFKGVLREQGTQQAMYEPLFLFNYDVGDLEPWLAAEPRISNGQIAWPLAGTFEVG
jgi:peptide/nickel transport system substrate-binding protein